MWKWGEVDAELSEDDEKAGVEGVDTDSISENDSVACGVGSEGLKC